MKNLITSAFLFLSVACCTLSNKDENLNLNMLEAYRSEQQCSTDGDCALINKACCSCNMGGAQVAVAAKFTESILKRRENSCKQTLCAAVISKDPSCGSTARAVCENGYCAITSM